jgi:hypothetical protein
MVCDGPGRTHAAAPIFAPAGPLVPAATRAAEA